MATKKAIVRQVQGLTFAARTDDGSWIMMDGPAALGGNDGAPRPKEMLLMALGGCTGSDVASILKKKRVPLEGFEVHLSAEVREEHPQIFTTIHVEYRLTGFDIRPQDVERAIELSSTKYCAVSAMIRGNVDVRHSYKILEPEVKAPEAV